MPMMNTRYPLMLAAVCSLTSLSACGAEVLVMGDAPSETTDVCSEHETATSAIRTRERGSFIDGQLHLMAALDDEAVRYTVIGLQDESAKLIAQPELSGPAQLLPSGEGTYLRLVTGEGAEGTQVQALDLQDPSEPAIVWSRDAQGTVPERMRHTLTVIDGHLFFCLTPEGLETGTAVLDLSEPLAPEALERWLFGSCSEDLDGAAAAGSLWAGFSAGEGNEVSDVSTWQLGPEQADMGVSFGYNPSGVHSYGRARSIATDGQRVVVDPASSQWLLLFNEGDIPLSGPYVAFGPAGPKKLLAVHDAVAYFATPAGVHSYDLSDLAAPVMGETRAELQLDPEAAVFIAIDEQRLAIADSDGALYIVPLGRTTQPQPLTLAGDTPACE